MAITFYIRLVLLAAGTHSASIAQTILFFIFVLIGAAIWILPSFGMIINSTLLQDIFADPKIYAVLFVSVSLTRLLCAPYWVWKKERAKKEELEQLLVPKLIVRLVLGQGSDASEETKNLRRLISINVANCSAVSVTNCQIKFLQCYVSEPFDLRPGESRSVIIFFIKEDEKHGIYSARVEALSYFKTAIWQRQHTVLTLEEGDYLIEVFSEKSVAVHLKIRLSKDTYWSVDVVSQ